MEGSANVPMKAPTSSVLPRLNPISSSSLVADRRELNFAGKVKGNVTMRSVTGQLVHFRGVIGRKQVCHSFQFRQDQVAIFSDKNAFQLNRKW